MKLITEDAIAAMNRMGWVFVGSTYVKKADGVVVARRFGKMWDDDLQKAFEEVKK